MMDILLNFMSSLGPTIITILFVLGIYYVANFLLSRQSKGKADWSIIKSLILFAIALIGFIAIILSLPMDQGLKGQVTGLIGIVISAALALSSATFIGNGLAGIMLRSINSFKPGDFIRVNDHFGRITERGLFHTEIQTENRDLKTLPNLYLATNPVSVTRATGTFISSMVSLGYDVNRLKIEKALLQAAQDADLKDPFVRITELGDYSVVYKVYGMLEEIKTILTAESRLNVLTLDALHGAGIEIVSPTFMNQRQVGETVFIPKKTKIKDSELHHAKPEDLIFDKADEAESLEKLKERQTEALEKINTIEKEIKDNDDEKLGSGLDEKLSRAKKIIEYLQDRITQREENLKDKA